MPISFRLLEGVGVREGAYDRRQCHCAPGPACTLFARTRAEAERLFMPAMEGFALLPDFDFSREAIVFSAAGVCPTIGDSLIVTSVDLDSKGVLALHEELRSCGGGELVSFPATLIAVSAPFFSEVTTVVVSGCPIP